MSDPRAAIYGVIEVLVAYGPPQNLSSNLGSNLGRDRGDRDRRRDCCEEKCGRVPFHDDRLQNPFDVKQIDNRLFISSTNAGLMLIAREDGKIKSSVSMSENAPAPGAPYGIIPNTHEDTFDGESGTERLFVVTDLTGVNSEASTLLLVDRLIGPEGYAPQISPDQTLRPPLDLNGDFRGGTIVRGKPGDKLNHVAVIANFGVSVTVGVNGINSFTAPNFSPIPPNTYLIDPHLSIGNLYRAYTIYQSHHSKQHVYVIYNYNDGNGNPVPGYGRISVFNSNGDYIRSIADEHLTAPVGLVEFELGHKKIAIVANQGDGKLRIYDVKSGKYLGKIKDNNGEAIKIPGVNAITEKKYTPETHDHEDHHEDHRDHRDHHDKKAILFTAYNSQTDYSAVGEVKLTFH